MKKSTSVNEIIEQSLNHHILLIRILTYTAMGFSGWFWIGLPTHNYTLWTIPALTGAALSAMFVFAYEQTKASMAESGDVKKVALLFIGFSMITAVGTHMHNEQNITEKKLQNSAIFNTAIVSVKESDSMIREYAYAAAFNVAALEAEKAKQVDVFLKQEALNAAGKPSGNTIGAMMDKGKSYAQYKTQLADLKKSYDEKIHAKQKYDSAVAARQSGSTNAQSLDATETAEANWLFQVFGMILELFLGKLASINVWASFVFFFVASLVVEFGIMYHGKKIHGKKIILYGFDPSDINSVVAYSARQSIEHNPAPAIEQAPATVETPAIAAIETNSPLHDAHVNEFNNQPVAIETPVIAEIEPTPAPVPALPFMSIKDTGRHCYKIISNMVNSGALPLTKNHIISAARIEFTRLSKTHELESTNHENAGTWIYNELVKERNTIQQLAQQAKQTPAPAPVMATAQASAPVMMSSALADDQPISRPIGFHAKYDTASAIATPRVDTVHTPPADTVYNRVDTVQHAPSTRVDTVQHGQANTVSNTVNTPDIADQYADTQTTELAIAAIWKGIDNGTINRISVRDNGQCQQTLKANTIGKSNPHRRLILQFVFDALNRENVLTRNPEYTGSESGKAEWLINQTRSIKYAA